MCGKPVRVKRKVVRLCAVRKRGGGENERATQRRYATHTGKQRGAGAVARKSHKPVRETCAARSAGPGSVMRASE